MKRIFISLCTSAFTCAPFLLTACPALQQGQVPCESSLDCPTSYGCGSSKICSQNLPESELTVEPSKASVVAPGTTTFTAKLDGQSTSNITWSVEGTGTGTIDSSGKYTAPSAISASMKVTIWAALKRHPDFKASATVTVQPPDNTAAWVMSYFRTGSPPKSVAQDSLYLAYSTDGLKWSPLGRSTPAYQLTGIGSNHLRDPFILRKQDGTFVVLATDWTRAYGKEDYWSSPSPNIIVIDSADLITFTNPRLLPVTPIQDTNTGIPMHAWAPEAFYDPDREQYGILWAGNDANNVNRIYVSYTKDFQTLVNPDPIVFFDPGYSVIDATLVRTDTHNYLFFKDETENNGGPSTGSGKDIQIARSPSTALTPRAFTRSSPDYVTRGSDQSTQVRSEGPFVVKQQQSNTWYMCADLFDLGSFGCWSTTDLDASPGSWKRLGSADFAMPPNAQHGNTVRVTQAELDALISKYGTNGTVKIKSTYVDSSGRSLYLVHSWFHGIITYDTDTAAGQLPADFYFKIAPGLSNPDDPSLVSFASTNFSGRWLRVNSANPTAWPEGRSLSESNQSQYMSQIPAGNKDHLLWLDEFQSSVAFAKDATFKIVQALNGDSSMISLKWCGDSTDGTCDDIADPRYLCYSYFQVFAYRATDPCGVDPNNPQSPATPEDAMSFTIIHQK
jgi:hypothetical protein